MKESFQTAKEQKYKSKKKKNVCKKISEERSSHLLHLQCQFRTGFFKEELKNTKMKTQEHASDYHH